MLALNPHKPENRLLQHGVRWSLSDALKSRLSDSFSDPVEDGPSRSEKHSGVINAASLRDPHGRMSYPST